jgi:shikimate dehydrogenase
VSPDQLAQAVHGAHSLGFQGLNVTVPHKVGTLSLCVTVDSAARLIGAVNTLRRSPNGWEGFNTDAPAFLAYLEAAGAVRGKRALLIGSGGAARSAAWALLKAGTQLRIAARRVEKGKEVAHALASVVAPAHPAPMVVSLDDLARECREADVVVNGTSIGLAGHEPEIPGISFRHDQLAIDWVYGDTAFARTAKKAGARLVTGEQLLVRQGAIAFTIWTGRPAPEPVMMAAVAANLERNP